jgi:DDB1- and CUL4-associated factor 11
LIRNRDLGTALFQDDEDDEEDDDIGVWDRRRRRPRAGPEQYPKIPSEAGMELMHSGVFGENDYRIKKKKQLVRRVLDRELGLGDRFERKRNQNLMAQVSGCHDKRRTPVANKTTGYDSIHQG